MTVGKLPYTFYYICNSDVLDLRPLWILFDWICGGLLRHSATILSCLAQASPFRETEWHGIFVRLRVMNPASLSFLIGVI